MLSLIGTRNTPARVWHQAAFKTILHTPSGVISNVEVLLLYGLASDLKRQLLTWYSCQSGIFKMLVQTNQRCARGEINFDLSLIPCGEIGQNADKVAHG